MSDSDLHPELRALLDQAIAGRYRVDALIGEGAMGAVFRAHHLGLQRDFAIKVLHPDTTRNAQVAARFDREAYSSSRLDHPNCLQVIDVGTTDSGLKFMVMQLLSGHPLAQLLGGSIAVDHALLMMLQVLRGLEHAHEKGVVHRDVKPENIFVTKDHDGAETLKIVDFGIAKLVGGAAQGHARVTQAGLVFGTPTYMSPEQALGQDADARADLYAVGVILYELINGTPPFSNPDVIALLRMHVTHPVPPLPEHVPQVVADFVYRLLAKLREDRFQSAAQAREALEIIIPIVMTTDVFTPLPFELDPSQSLEVHAPPIEESGALARAPAERSAITRPPRRSWVPLGAGATMLALAAIAGVIALGGASRTPASTIAATPPALEPAGRPDALSATAPLDGPDPAKLAELDRLILGRQLADARKVIDPMLDEHPDDAQLVWRQGRLLAQDKATKAKALATYGHALELDPALVEHREFYDEIYDLLRIRSLRDQALAIAMDRMGAAGHRFLLEQINDHRRPLSYSERHFAIEILKSDPEHAELIDRRLHRGLDLVQATQAPNPCTIYAQTLEAIASEPDPSYIARLEQASVPTPEHAPADASSCDGLTARRLEVLEALRPLAPAAAPKTKKKRKKSRARSR